jgi:mannitol-specific phosphotransferase system IIBC component
MKKLLSLAAAAAIGLSLVVAPVVINTSDSAAYAATKKDKKAGKKAKKSKSGKKAKSAKAAKAGKVREHNPLSAFGCLITLGTADYCRA